MDLLDETEAFEHRYRAVQSRDGRFDGWFVTAVTSTGIYCRPSCPAVTPRRENIRFYPTAAAAQHAGFRACMRCRPDAAPGSPEWDLRKDVVGRAMRLIRDGVVDRCGVSGLAAQVGYSERQLHRLLVAEVGAGPQALARAQRAQTARILLETTDLPGSQVAFGAGFASVRQYNETVRDVFAMTPTELRTRQSVRRPTRRAPERPGGGGGGGVAHLTSGPTPVRVRLAMRPPFDGEALVSFLARRCVPGVEAVEGGVYRRSMRLHHGDAVAELAAGPDEVDARFWLADLRDLAAAVTRCRRLLDLDADPVAVADALGPDPLIGPLVVRSPGRRVARAVDGPELAVRAVIGQQVSVAAARAAAGRLVVLGGRRLDLGGPPSPGAAAMPTHLFPSPDELLSLGADRLPMPRVRGRALLALCTELESGRLRIDPAVAPTELQSQLAAIDGIGPWTAAYVTMRALGDPDAFLPTDLGVRRAMRGLGASDEPRSIGLVAEAWRPWRSYAVAHLWALETGAGSAA
ncbi:MAG TPA: AlkA N-terminal domain-containing protein [Acidimicrobiales bacterium]